MTGIELLVGGWFASPVIKSVLQKAQNHLGANHELHKNTQGLVKTLTINLELCQASVTEIEKSMIINNTALTDWLRRFKLAVYDAEDVLDDMEAKSIKEKVQGKNKFLVSKFASSSLSGLKNLFLQDEDHKSLKKVVDQLNQLYTDIPTVLKLVDLNAKNGSHGHKVTDQRETISQSLEEVGLYGREEELNLILQIILDSETESKKKEGQNYNTHHGVFVVPIVGIGGVGKTALAQAVYNNPAVKQAFASKAWISVSCNLTAIMVMRKIIQSLGGYLRQDVTSLEDTTKNLSAVIGGARFLVVLDGMFDKIEYHDVVLTILSRGALGSVVIITTQNQAFANRVATPIYVALNALDMDIIWELLEYFVFRNLVMSEGKRKTLEVIGKQIASKLRGLPLAAKVIGNLLRSKVDVDEWRKLAQNEWWQIPEGKSQILPSIGLNYECLDPYLRQCFAYCSVFPKNSLIEKDRLVQMWIAQNFILHDINGARPEDVGRQWFDRLLEMSFFQPTGDYKGYVIPELMHDLASIVSTGECFYLSNESNKIPEGVRHIAVDTEKVELIQGIRKCKHLRSFFYFGCTQTDDICNTINEALFELDSIRVLDLSYLDMRKKEPPTVIPNLTHLRFLDLSSTGIEVLSNTSCDLYQLQALYLRNCQFLTIPKGINKLINLRHLVADVETIDLISGIGKLTKLQELNVYTVLKKEGHGISELKYLREITGHLKIDNCENIKSKDDAMQSNLVDKKHLDHIEICWSSVKRKSNIDTEILEGLRPHEHISELTIWNYMGPSFPDWTRQISRFTNLKKVRLSFLEKVEVLPHFGELPSLNYLWVEGLSSMKILDHNFYGNAQTAFPVLKEFFFLAHPSCEEWTEPQVGEAFPHLAILEINDCNLQRKAPLYLFGTTLKVLRLNRCGLKFLEEYLGHLNFLTTLSIEQCKVTISLNIRGLRLLENLKLLDCPELSLQGNLQLLTNLKRLEVSECPKLLSSQQKGKALELYLGESFQSLTFIEMDQSLLLYDYHQIFGRLPSLRELILRNSQVRRFSRWQILWFQELANLQELTIHNCEYEELPSSLAMISSLRKMLLSCCTKLQSRPANGMPPFLWELTLTSCSQNLVQRCQPNEGADWYHISQVLLIQVDGRIIYRSPCTEGTLGQ